VVFRVAVSAATGFFTATVHLVHGSPGPTLGFFFRYASAFVPFFYVLSLAFLFVGVFGFVSARHFALLIVRF
jgi:hypothetical protein